jgi:hypothetical protein
VAGPPSGPPLFSPPSFQASLTPGQGVQIPIMVWDSGITATRPDLAYSQKGRERPSAVPRCCLFGLERCKVLDYASEKRRPFCVNSRSKGPMSPRLVDGPFGIWCGLSLPDPRPSSQREHLLHHVSIYLHSLFKQHSALHFCIHCSLI